MDNKKWYLLSFAIVLIASISVVAMEASDIEGDTISLNDLQYDAKNQIITVSGSSDVNSVHFRLFDSEGNDVGTEGYAKVVNGKFSTKYSIIGLELEPGTYTVKAWTTDSGTYIGSKNVSVVEYVAPTPTPSTSISIDSSVNVYKDYTLSVKVGLIGATYSEVTVTSRDPSIAEVKGTRLNQDSTLTIEGKSVGTTDIVLNIPGKIYKTLTVTVEEDPGTPCSEYYFYIVMRDGADTGGRTLTGPSEIDVKNGFWVKGFGNTAKAALQYVAREYGWDLSFDETFYEGWLNTFLGLKTVTHTNGDYTYWAQYHWNGSNWVYNQYCLGYLKTTDYQYLAMEFSRTSSDDATTSLSVTPSDIPTDVRNKVRASDSSGSSSETVTNNDGSTTTTETNPDGSKTETTTEKPTTTKDKDGNTSTVTPSKTVNYDADGNVTGFSENTKTEIKNSDGSEKVIEVEQSKDKDGNVVGSTETSETKDKDGNVTGTTNIVKDAEGKEVSYEKTEIVPEKTVTDSDGNKVTESSSKKDVKDVSGKVTVTEESNKEIVGTDGSKETEKVKTETVTDASGSTTSMKVTENTVDDAESTVKSVQTETKAADGKETVEKKVEAESKDGNVKSTVEIPQDADKAEIVTVVKSGSEDGSSTVSKEQMEQAIAIQEKVSDSISGDVAEQSKIIQVESEAVDVSLTVSKDAVKAVSDSGSDLKMSSQEGSMQISKEILNNLSDVEDVTISFSKTVEGKMTDAQKDAVDEKATVLELKITSGDTSLGDRLGGTLTVTVKHKQAEGMVAVAYYIADDGTKEKLNGTYDPEKEEMSFETAHCSIYAVVDESSEPEPVPGPIVDPDEPSSGDKDDGMMLYIGIAIAVIAAIAVAGVLYMRKN